MFRRLIHYFAATAAAVAMIFAFYPSGAIADGETSDAPESIVMEDDYDILEEAESFLDDEGFINEKELLDYFNLIVAKMEDTEAALARSADSEQLDPEKAEELVAEQRRTIERLNFLIDSVKVKMSKPSKSKNPQDEQDQQQRDKNKDQQKPTRPEDQKQKQDKDQQGKNKEDAEKKDQMDKNRDDQAKEATPPPDSLPGGEEGIETRRAAEDNGAWARMQPKEREDILKAARQKYPPKYREWLKKYFERLAEKEKEED